MPDEANSFPFRPRARLLQLLGDQLIGSARLAVFELVKNSYDADASRVDITLSDLDTDAASITVIDDGDGMTLKTITNVWLVPGHDYRREQRAKGQRTARGRLPLGEKGLGRFAVHKLGNVIELVTRASGEDEVVVRIDWDDLMQVEYLADTSVEVVSRKPIAFVGAATGTKITVTSLRGEPWTRGEVRRLARQVTSISSPFVTKLDGFQVQLQVPGKSDWLADIKPVTTLLERAPWKFDFVIENNQFSWNYEFLGVPGIGASKRRTSGNRRGVLLDTTYLAPAFTERLAGDGKPPKEVVSTPEYQRGIGRIAGTFFAFDRDRAILDKMADPAAIETFLNDNGGVRIYRDGVRVYNYGEQSDDWLGLDIRRVNVPSKRLSRNITVGAVELDLQSSLALEEKTNREGFVENLAFFNLQALVLGAVAAFEIERNIDKEILRQLTRKARDIDSRSVSRPLRQLKKLAKTHGLTEQVEPIVRNVEASYNEMREIMLRSGVSGMTLAVVFHEIDHGVRLLRQALEKGASADSVVGQARELSNLLDGFGDLLRRGDIHTYDVKLVVERALALNRVRLRNHNIRVVVDDSVDRDVLAHLPFGLVLGAITNLVDNSIYWLRTKWPDQSAENRRAVFISIDDRNFAGGPAIIFADNGPGVQDALSDLVRPFYSRRPDGIGIGLYYINTIMTLSDGSLQMPARGEVSVPAEFDGAVFALVFKRSTDV